jgi:predicted RNase H-like HicB family nuclease
MDFYTIVLRKSGAYWVALCLENGIVGQGDTKEKAVQHLKEAVESVDIARKEDPETYLAPISVKELHEFLSVEAQDPILEPMELRAIYA